MRLVSGIDDGTLHHRVEINQAFEEVRPLRNLELHRAGLILCSDLSGPRVNESGDEERSQRLHDQLKRHRPGEHIVLVIAVAVAFAVGIILVQHELLTASDTRHVIQALG